MKNYHGNDTIHIMKIYTANYVCYHQLVRIIKRGNITSSLTKSTINSLGMWKGKIMTQQKITH